MRVLALLLLVGAVVEPVTVVGLANSRQLHLDRPGPQPNAGSRALLDIEQVFVGDVHAVNVRANVRVRSGRGSRQTSRSWIAIRCDYLAVQPRTWVRVAANRLDADWQLSLLEIVVAEPPPGWRRQRWSYDRTIFVASAPVGKTVARWLERERIALPGLSIKLQLDGSVGVERRASNFQGIYQQLPWPTHEWNVYVRDSSGQSLHDELVAAETPAFIGYDQAAAAFFGVPPRPNRNFSGREIVVRRQDRRARIDYVLVRPTELVVKVSGDQLRGTSLTVGGAAGPTGLLSRRTEEVRLRLSAELGSSAWLALHRDRELLDRRILDPAWGGKDFEVEVDASTRVELLISRGEQATIEFKRQPPGSDPSGV